MVRVSRCTLSGLPLPIVIDFMKFVCHHSIQCPARRLCLSSGRQALHALHEKVYILRQRIR